MKRSIAEKRCFCVLLALILLFSSAAPVYAADEEQFIIGLVAQENSLLNPFCCTQRDFISMNELVFESLITLGSNLKPIGELALSWETDGNAYIVRMRRNICFSDGSPLTSADVLASFQRIAQVGSSGPYYARCQYITSISAIDDYTLLVHGKYSSYYTLYALAFPVLKSDTVDMDTAIGSGPYAYQSYDMNRLQLAMNRNWWKVAPTVSSILGIRYNDTGDALTALSLGTVDAVATRSQNAALGRLLNDRVSVDYATNTYEMLIPNIRSDIFKDPRTRQAIMYALDVTTIANNIYMGMVTESEVPVQPGSWLYEPQSAVYYESKERALQLLHDAGWNDYNQDGILDYIEDNMLIQLEFTITTCVDDAQGTRSRAAQLICDQLAPLGIKAKVSTVSKTTLQKNLKNRNFEMVLCGINTSLLPDLTFLLNSGGRMNYSGYSNAAMNQYLNDLYTLTDESQFLYTFKQIQMKIVEELPFLGLFFRKGTLMTTANVTGLDAVMENDALRGIEYIEFQD